MSRSVPKQFYDHLELRVMAIVIFANVVCPCVREVRSFAGLVGPRGQHALGLAASSSICRYPIALHGLPDIRQLDESLVQSP